jgi:hypothetical protein
MKQKKLMLIIALFAFSTLFGVLPTEVQAETGSWIDMTTTRTLYHGTYNSGTQVAAEGVFQSSYIFSCHWSTANAVPGGRDTTAVRVKFYFAPYFWWLGFYYNQPIRVTVQNYDYSSAWGPYTYYPSSYVNGGYIYINLGSSAENHRIRIIISDGDGPDSFISKWTIGEPIVQYYSTA